MALFLFSAQDIDRDLLYTWYGYHAGSRSTLMAHVENVLFLFHRIHERTFGLEIPDGH
jgi:hypothetical protein